MINAKKEQEIERFIRKKSWLLYLVTISVSLGLYLGIYWSLQLFQKGHYWSLLISGLFAHSFFVITMHDGAHKSITRTKFDYIIMNFCAGLIILPLYTELFKKYHLLHHAHTNTELDPLWSVQKEKLFTNKRILYAFLQCLPFAFNLYIIMLSSKKSEVNNPKSTKPQVGHIFLSFAVAASIVYFFRPSVWFVLGTFTVMTTLGAVRYWGEHMGVKKNKESNTHWFPLGMGIGNHEVHHHNPGYSWLTLTLGMLFRKMDTNPIKSIYGIFFRKDFHHYKQNE